MANNNPPRELTRNEIKETRQLVTKWCANYDREYGCLPLDGACFMFGKAYAGGAMCIYFRSSVLPLSPELEAVYNGEDVKEHIKKCSVCGDELYSTSNNVKYCADCAKKVKLRRNRDYKREKLRFEVGK